MHRVGPGFALVQTHCLTDRCSRWAQDVIKYRKELRCQAPMLCLHTCNLKPDVPGDPMLCSEARRQPDCLVHHLGSPRNQSHAVHSMATG